MMLLRFTRGNTGQFRYWSIFQRLPTLVYAQTRSPIYTWVQLYIYICNICTYIYMYVIYTQIYILGSPYMHWVILHPKRVPIFAFVHKVGIPRSSAVS